MKHLTNDEFTPRRATFRSAGYDLFIDEEVTLYPGVFKTLDTHVVLEDKDRVDGVRVSNSPAYSQLKHIVGETVQNDWVVLVFPRSSYGFKYGMRFANTVGIIDMDYRDTIKLAVTVDKEVTLNVGDRVAQMVVVPFCVFENEVVPTKSRSGGIGSTGN